MKKAVKAGREAEPRIREASALAGVPSARERGIPASSEGDQET